MGIYSIPLRVQSRNRNPGLGLARYPNGSRCEQKQAHSILGHVAAAGVPAEPRGKRQKMVTFKKIETAPRGAKQQVGVLGSLCVAGSMTACAGGLRKRVVS
jgi:hypothetical protein